MSRGATSIVAAPGAARLAIAASVVFVGCARPADRVLETLAGGDAFRTSIERGEITSVVQAIERGADPNRAFQDGYSPLHVASFHGRAAVVQSLLDAGGDPNIVSADGFTPLHVAIFLKAAHADVVELLLQRKADPNRILPAAPPIHYQNPHATMYMHVWLNGWTALHFAAFLGDRPLVERLLAAGADRNTAATDGALAAEVARRQGRDALAEWLGTSR